MNKKNATANVKKAANNYADVGGGNTDIKKQVQMAAAKLSQSKQGNIENAFK